MADALARLVVAIAIAFFPLLITIFRMRRRAVRQGEVQQGEVQQGEVQQGEVQQSETRQREEQPPAPHNRRGKPERQRRRKRRHTAGNQETGAAPAETGAGSLISRFRGWLERQGVVFLGEPAPPGAPAGTRRPGTSSGTGGSAPFSRPSASLRQKDFLKAREPQRSPARRWDTTGQPADDQNRETAAAPAINRLPELQRALVWSDVLGPPRGLRPWDDDSHVSGP